MQNVYKKSRIPDGERRKLAQRYGMEQGDVKAIKCHYCDSIGKAHWFEGRSWVSFQDLEMDHIVPELHGGASIEENLVLACRKCNRSKGARLTWLA